MINLFIALFWLVLGIGFLVIPAARDYQILNTGIRFGWVPIGLACYNLLRWLLWRAQQRPRYVKIDGESPPAPREYNSEFDFTKDPPQPK